ncbi:bone morphogenetic protein 1 isoform X2 [Nematostella vectensis]|uniref:bone morphogenetic protein 1 isoform X2 n=1 Tax=Nematostella vectensis TaxID=45351 RepID=UPI002077445B|nr:bone morphogenetic protein 1 isoform X2 [Nematostella vectensis]
MMLLFLNSRIYYSHNRLFALVIPIILSAVLNTVTGLAPSTKPARQKTCHELINSTSEDLYSPDFPNASPLSRTCSWQISAPNGKHVAIQSMEINVGGVEWECTQGYLEIWDGCGADRFLVEKICSTRFQSEQRYLWVSTGSCVIIKFNSAGGSKNKFFLRTTHTSKSCNKVLKDQNSGKLTTVEALPAEQPECIWIIAVPRNRIELKFVEEFKIRGNGADCKDDSLRIQDGRFSSSQLLGIFCGHTRPYPVFSTEPYIRVTLQSTESRIVSGNHFSAKYAMIDKRPSILGNYCNSDMIMTTPHGAFVSPGYPDQYPHLIRCVWKIHVSSGFKISFRFRDFDIQGDSMECQDYVEIFDGLASWAPIKGRYCGKDIPPVLRSVSNKLRVVFTSDKDYAGRGFEAIYSEFDPKSDEEDNSRSQFTGIMIGTTCGIIFIVLSVLAVFHARKIRMRREQSRRCDAASTLSFDVHQANAPPSYDIVMASPDLFPAAPKSSETMNTDRTYADTPHLHREVCRLLGDPDSDEEEPPPAYHGLFPEEEGFVYSFGTNSNQTVGYHRGRRTSQPDQAEGVVNTEEGEDPDSMQARIWQRRELERIRNCLTGRNEHHIQEPPKPNSRPTLERQDTCSSFVTDV